MAVVALYLILDISLPKDVDTTHWRVILSRLWHSKYLREPLYELRVFIPNLDDSDQSTENVSIIPQTDAVSLSFPSALKVVEEQLVAVRREVLQKLRSYLLCRREYDQMEYEGFPQRRHGLQRELQCCEEILANPENLPEELFNLLTRQVTEIQNRQNALAKHKTRTECRLREAAQCLSSLEEITRAKGELRDAHHKLHLPATSSPRCGGCGSGMTIQLLDRPDLSITSGAEMAQPKNIDLFTLLKDSERIVFVVGAGISVSGGGSRLLYSRYLRLTNIIIVPDFRSENGIFAQVRRQHSLSGEDLFSISMYNSPETTRIFHKIVRSLFQQIQSAKHTPFHHLMNSIASEGRLLRVYTQNIDGLDTSLPNLETNIPLPVRGPWPQTIQLHGSMRKMICTRKGHLHDLEPDLFRGPSKPTCRDCAKLVRARRTYNHKDGMKPRFTLYEEIGPDDHAINAAIEDDRNKSPDAIFAVGTSLGIPSVQQLVRDMAAHGGATVWINKDPPPHLDDMRWDLIVQGYCDEVARGYLSREDSG